MTFLINIGVLLALLTVFLTFLSWRWTAAVAIAGFLCVFLAAPGTAELTTLLFWGIAALLVLSLNVMLPRAVSTARQGLGYVAGGALTGLFIGYLISPTWIVFGAILGVVFGAIAYSLTPRGRHLEFPSSKFIQYLCAKGLPAVVNMSIAAFTILEVMAAKTAP